MWDAESVSPSLAFTLTDYPVFRIPRIPNSWTVFVLHCCWVRLISFLKIDADGKMLSNGMREDGKYQIQGGRQQYNVFLVWKNTRESIVGEKIHGVVLGVIVVTT